MTPMTSSALDDAIIRVTGDVINSHAFVLLRYNPHRFFPLLQALTILLSSDWCSSAVVFDKDMTKDDVIIRENVLPSGAWSTCSHVITSRGTDTSRARDYNLYSLQAHVKRKAESFLWSTVVPQVSITFLNTALHVSVTCNNKLIW